MRAVIGIDPSLTGTGVAVALPDAPPYLDTFTSKHERGVRGRVRRYQVLLTPVMELVRTYQPALAVVENYSLAAMNSKGRTSAAERIGLGEILRFLLIKHGVVVVDVNPTQLKRFVSGQGNPGKLVQHVRARWGGECADDNQADAYGLMMLGLCLGGRCAPESGVQHDLVRMLRPQMEAA